MMMAFPYPQHPLACSLWKSCADSITPACCSKSASSLALSISALTTPSRFVAAINLQGVGRLSEPRVEEGGGRGGEGKGWDEIEG